MLEQKTSGENMDDATLQRLMIDEALGALDPDVSALLDAYTADLPASSGDRAAWQKLAQTARQAMPVAAAETLPPLRISRVPGPGIWRGARATLALAAAIAMGIGIGLWRARPETTTVTVVAPAAQSFAGPQAVSLPPPPANGQSFWSSQRLLAMAQAQRSEAHAKSAGRGRAFGFEWLQLQTQGVQ
jgi:hypothetical protein